MTEDPLSPTLPNPTALQPGSPAAAAVVWPWRTVSSGAAAQSRRSALRREGAIRALVGAVVGALLWRNGGIGSLSGVVVARVAWIGSGLVLIAALVSPDGLYAALGRGLALLGHGIGRLFAIVFLTPVFFLVFVPFGWLFRSGRRDRLERWFERGSESGAATYWHRRDDAPRTKRSYEKAF